MSRGKPVRVILGEAARRRKTKPRLVAVKPATAQVVAVKPATAQVVAVKSGSSRVTRAVRRVRGAAKKVNKDVLQEVMTSVTSAFHRTPFVVTALVAVAIALTSTKTTGPIHDFCKPRSDPFCRYFLKNFDKVLGYVIFSVAVVDVPIAYRLAVGAASFLWVYVIPEATPLEYVIQAAIIHSFFRVRLEGSRFLLIALGVVAYFSGFVVFNKSN
nr:MAG: hypothetical protein [Wenzhou bat ribovirus 3]